MVFFSYETLAYYLRINNMQTKGGYKILNFRKLNNPIILWDGREYLYQGTVKGALKSDVTIKWDVLGQCTNLARTDCFIDVNDITKALA